MEYDKKLNDRIWDAFSSNDGEDRRFIRKQMDIAAQIDTILKQTGWTQKQLAEESGLRPSQISKIMSGDANPTLRTIVSIEDAFNQNIIVCPEFFEIELENEGWNRPSVGFELNSNSYRTYDGPTEASLHFVSEWHKPIRVKNLNSVSESTGTHHKQTG